MSRFDWALLFEHGHRYFLDRNTGEVYVGDESGATPPETFDGPMLLDWNQPIRQDLENGLWKLPLRHLGGKPSSTPVSWNEVVMLAMTFKRLKVITAFDKELPVWETVYNLPPPRPGDYL